MSTTYVVKSGDTLSKIASQYGVKGGYKTLASYNNIANPNQINVGQKIVIPDTSSSTSQTSSSSSSSSIGKVQVTASTLNVRKGPGTGYGILGTLARGKVISYSEDSGGWLKISYGGSNGWISKDWTTKVSSDTTPADTSKDTSSSTDSSSSQTDAKTTKMYVTASSLNVRQGPGTNYTAITQIPYGTEVAVISTSNGWCKINFNGGTAYVSADHVTKDNLSSGASSMASGTAYPLTVEKLDKVASGAKNYFAELTNAMALANISTKQRACCFVAQLAHESGNFYYMEEIADGSAYEFRSSLGNIYPGDGKKFKGRGPIQITGRDNYTRASQALGLDLVNHPEMASNPAIGFQLSAWFWNANGLNKYCDNYDFTGLTRAINGGTMGLSDRQNYYNKAQNAF